MAGTARIGIRGCTLYDCFELFCFGTDWFYSCHGNDYGSCHSSKGSIGTAFGHNGRPSRQKETDCHRGFNPGSKYFACHSSLQIWNSENMDADGSSSNRWDLFSIFLIPAVESSLPDIVTDENVMRANSVYQIATTGAEIFGQSLGGAIYSQLGAPVMFLINGISYLFSASTEIFIKIPNVVSEKSKGTFREDFKDGIHFVLRYEGMIRVIVMSFFINFLFGIIRVLIIPWFVDNPQLGMTRYGVLSAAQSIGILIGMTVLSVVRVKASQKYNWYKISLFSFILMIGVAVTKQSILDNPLLFFLAFGFQMIFNMIMNSTVMQRTPVNKRGKVSAMKTTLGMAISPFGNFVGGMLGEVWNPRGIMFVSVLLAVITVSVIVIHPTVKEFLNYDTTGQK